MNKREKMVEEFGEIVAEEFHRVVLPELLMVAPTGEYKSEQPAIKLYLV